MMSIDPKGIIRSFARNANPMRLLSNLARRNPIVSQAMQMINGQTEEQMECIVRNVAHQRGVDLDELAEQAGIRLRKQ